MISGAVLLGTGLALAVLLFAPFTRTVLWRATITPLASIIGSGFLVSAPLLAQEFGGYAALAMGALIVTATLLGWAMRYNIRVVEPMLEDDADPVLHSLSEVGRLVLAFAYFVSVAYYLSLLGHFVLEAAGLGDDARARGISIALMLGLGLLGWTGGAERVASLERYATSLNLAVIFGFLLALAIFGLARLAAGQAVAPPPGRLAPGSLPVLLGLLIVVQGFETSRFMGAQFDRPTRIRAMRLAQIVSGAIYLVFFLLLSPLLADLADGSGVAAIISVSAGVAAVLPLALTVAATGSQFSAAVADSVGNVGLMQSLGRKRIDARHGYALVALVGTAILVTGDVTAIIAFASRAFALFYALQCLIAWEAARHRREDRGKSLAFGLLAIVAALVCLFGAPSGG